MTSASKQMEEILHEILRHSLLYLRTATGNVSHVSVLGRLRLNSVRLKATAEVAELCHTIPPLLMGLSEEREANSMYHGIRHFYELNGKIFIRDYPDKKDWIYEQLVLLLKELEAAHRFHTGDSTSA